MGCLEYWMGVVLEEVFAKELIGFCAYWAKPILEGNWEDWEIERLAALLLVFYFTYLSNYDSPKRLLSWLFKVLLLVGVN